MKIIVVCFLSAATMAIAQLPQDQIFRMNNPAVFMLSAVQANGSTTTATAFCIKQDGMLVTTWSNIVNATSATVRSIYDKDIRVLGVLGHDAEHNLAIIKVDDGGLSEVQLGQSTYTAANELVFIIGDSAPSANRMVQGVISGEYKKAREVEEYQPVIPVMGAFTARDNGAPILSGSGGRAIGVAMATDPKSGASEVRHTAVVIPVEELRLIMNHMQTTPEALHPRGEYDKANEGQYWAGRLDEVNGDIAGALDHYKAVLFSDTKNLAAAFQYAYLNEMQGNHRQAEQAYMRALAINPKQSQTFFNLGLITFNDGRFSEAEKHFAFAAGLTPKFLKAWDRLGLTQEQLKQPDKALASYAKAREIKETDSTANLRTAHILFDEQKWGAAAAAAKKSREAGVDADDIYLIEADSYLHTKSFLQSWDLANRGAQRNSKLARFWAIMTVSSHKLKLDDRAAQEMQTLQTLDPEMAKQAQADEAAAK